MSGVYQTETVSSISDLVTKLDTFMSSNGWIAEHLDTTATAGTGGEWAMRLIATGVEVRFAASWDAANSGTNLALYHYTDQDYVIADRPWGQDHDSGNGGAGTLDATITASRHVAIGASPVRYHAFLETNSHVYIIVETATGVFAHFGFGMGDKNGGDYTGGSFVYGQLNSSSLGSSQAIRDGRSHLLDGLFNDTGDLGDLSNGSELHAATIHLEGFANQPAGGKFAVCMGGKEGSPQTDFGTDRQSNDGVSSDVDRVLCTWGLRSGPWANGFYRASNTDMSGELRLWPICTSYVDTTTGDIHGMPTLKMKDVFGLNMRQYVAGDTITDDAGDTYYIFPAHTKYSGSGSEQGTSGYLGIAYKVPEAATSSPPSAFSELSAWWDFSDAANVTLEDNGRISQVSDKSGNALHLTQTTDARRPRRVDIDGMSYGQFQSGDTHWMSAAHDDLLDIDDSTFTMCFVLRQDAKTAGALLSKGNNPAAPRYHIRTYLSSGDSDSDGDLIVNTNDNVGSGDVYTNDTSEDWTGGDVQLITIQVDKTADIYRIYRNGVLTADSGDSISTVGTLSNTQDVFVGVQQDLTNTFPLQGQIGEIVILKGDFSTANIDLLNAWFIDKWSIGTDSYVDPGLPASVGTPTGWYSVRDSDDYTISSGEVTQLDDKSGNGNHLTPDGGTGPGLRLVRGLNWLDFNSSTPSVLRGDNTDINPGSGDFSCVCVFRSSTSTRQGLFYKIADGNEYFGTYIAFSNSRSMRYAMRDTVFANTLALDHDDAANDYTDGTPKVMSFTYDDSEADAKLHGTRGPLAQIDAQDPVLENLAYASGDIIPAAEFELGAWNNAEDLDGQIAEMIFFDTPLSEKALSELYDYLFTKWNLTEYYYDPGLPSSLPTVSAHWDASVDTDLTLSGSQITGWDDKVGSADWSVPGGKSGPDWRWIRGRKWAHFEAGSGWVMTQASIDAIEPGSDDWECVIVYKAEDHAAGNTGAMFGCKNTTGGSGATNTNYGVFIINSDGSLYTQIGENGSTTLVANDTTETYDDLDARIARVFYDHSADDLYLHGEDPTDISVVSASDTSGIIPDVTPDDDAALGDWSTDYDRQFRGQIAEIIIFKTAELSAAQETALQTYLSEKWGVEV